MPIGPVEPADLDDFVREVDERGGIATPEARSFVEGFELAHRTDVDESLDPFGEDYVEMQLDLYRELSGRDVDQQLFERSAVDVDPLVGKANPYGSRDPGFIGPHARTVLTSIVVSDLPPHARVLDMGCGWGLSTEMFGFCGCQVHAVDINRPFVELVERRAAVRGYDVEVEQSEFDSFESSGRYDLVFFYESLHHAIRPWRVVERVAPLVADGGKITIAGEPIQQIWWRNWGLRLDAESVYCIRKFGWFESGWSEDVIVESFRRAGFRLTLHPNLGILDTPIGVATRASETDPLAAGADAVGTGSARASRVAATLTDIARPLVDRLPPRAQAALRRSRQRLLG